MFRYYYYCIYITWVNTESLTEAETRLKVEEKTYAKMNTIWESASITDDGPVTTTNVTTNITTGVCIKTPTNRCVTQTYDKK